MLKVKCSILILTLFCVTLMANNKNINQSKKEITQRSVVELGLNLEGTEYISSDSSCKKVEVEIHGAVRGTVDDQDGHDKFTCKLYDDGHLKDTKTIFIPVGVSRFINIKLSYYGSVGHDAKGVGVYCDDVFKRDPYMPIEKINNVCKTETGSSVKKVNMAPIITYLLSGSSSEKLLISSINPNSGLVGQRVRLVANTSVNKYSKIFLSGKAINPIEVNGNNISFIIPNGAKSGPLYIESGGKKSNSLWFDVTSNSLTPATGDKIVVENGIEYAIGYLIVTLKEAHNTRENALQLAAKVSGNVIGVVEDMNWWQIGVNVSNLSQLKILKDRLASDPLVENVFIDLKIKKEAINFSGDVDIGEQRRRNAIEEAANLYEQRVSFTDSSKILPYQMAIGVSEVGINFDLPDFSDYVQNSFSTSNIGMYSLDKKDSHGSNVVGIMGAELGDGGNAGLIRALANSHCGANFIVTNGKNDTVASTLLAALEMAKNGTSVINWSWGLHKNGTPNCNGSPISGISDDAFAMIKKEIRNFFNTLEKKYPSVVVVGSAGNEATNTGATENRLPSSIVHDQFIVVGAHTSGANYSNGVNEDIADGSYKATSCYPGPSTATVKRAYYSNYGDRVDISASGTIRGYENSSVANMQGTSFAAPVVAQTVALMQSINPNLSPKEIKTLLRGSSFPIFNNVQTNTGISHFTRPIDAGESPTKVGLGARLNARGAIQAAINSLSDKTLPTAPTVNVTIPPSTSSVTRRISSTLPNIGKVYNKVDIMFLVDVSGSYRDDIDTFRNKATQIISAFNKSGADVRIGVSSFSDFPKNPYGLSYDYSFKLNQGLTNDSNKIINTLNGLKLLNGSDYKESQLHALYKTAMSSSGWRPGALPIIFLATDANFHNSDNDSSYPGVGYAKTLSFLNGKGIRVFSLQSGGSVSDAKDISLKTGGKAFSLSSDSAEVVESIVNALSTTSKNLTVYLKPYGDFAKTVSRIVPANSSSSVPSGSPILNVSPGEQVSFDVTFTKGILDKNHKMAFRLLIYVDNVAVIKEIPILLTK